VAQHAKQNTRCISNVRNHETLDSSHLVTGYIFVLNLPQGVENVVHAKILHNRLMNLF
jgi:hypothetical protein